MTHVALYNEIDSYAADWLDNLIAAGHIAPGRVDRRSIADLTPADVAGPGQRHFFAGIGGWSHALRLAGIADDADIWTGSCPCQPFSDAGKRGGTRDHRHLWPAWFALIAECRPPVIFGEQVASRAGLDWLDIVSTDLERCGYIVGAADLCAAGVGAPHIRQRLFFVAYAHGDRRFQGGEPDASPSAHDDRGGLGDAGIDRARQHLGELPSDEAQHEIGVAHGDYPSVPPGATRGFWYPADWLLCIDGVARPVEPGTFPLAARVPNRVGKLRAYGNSIVPQVAEVFIRCAQEAYALDLDPDPDLASGRVDMIPYPTPSQGDNEP